MAFPIRKSPRLSDYDYRANGYYFITICTHRKEKLLCKIVGEGLCALPSVILSDIGQSVYEAIRFISENYTGVSVDHYVIMPNHIHMLICFCRDSGGRGDPPLHDIIARFKSFTTHKYQNTLWQRSFHDHIIRGENDYFKIWQYIDSNPSKWKDDCFYTP